MSLSLFVGLLISVCLCLDLTYYYLPVCLSLSQHTSGGSVILRGSSHFFTAKLMHSFTSPPTWSVPPSPHLSVIGWSSWS